MSTYQNMASAIDYLVSNTDKNIDLQSLADKFSSDTSSFQKAFQGHVGVSPKQLQRYLTLKTAREFLLEGHSTLNAAYSAGISGNARLHDACLLIDAATPGELKARGQGLKILYGWAATQMGYALIAQTPRGICWLSFELDGNRAAPEKIMKARFKNAEFVQDEEAVKEAAHQIRALFSLSEQKQKIRLNLYGTNFQLKVWEALLRIPRGGCVSYGAVAHALNKPTASRAVGTAVGANPISFLIPCHRVIQQSGIVENYAWGSARKKVLLGIEGELEG